MLSRDLLLKFISFILKELENTLLLDDSLHATPINIGNTNNLSPLTENVAEV